MNNQEKAAKLAEIIANEEILKKLSNAETKEEMQAMFAENGLEMTISEIDAFVFAMNSDGEAEISEAELEGVAGGVDPIWIFTTAHKILKKIGKACWNAGKWWANNVG